jgi:hypothetical protein
MLRRWFWGVVAPFMSEFDYDNFVKMPSQNVQVLLLPVPGFARKKISSPAKTSCLYIDLVDFLD